MYITNSALHIHTVYQTLLLLLQEEDQDILVLMHFFLCWSLFWPGHPWLAVKPYVCLELYCLWMLMMWSWWKSPLHLSTEIVMKALRSHMRLAESYLLLRGRALMWKRTRTSSGVLERHKKPVADLTCQCPRKLRKAILSNFKATKMSCCVLGLWNSGLIGLKCAIFHILDKPFCSLICLIKSQIKLLCVRIVNRFIQIFKQLKSETYLWKYNNVIETWTYHSEYNSVIEDK